MPPSHPHSASLWRTPVALCMVAEIEGILVTRDTSGAGYWSRRDIVAHGCYHSHQALHLVSLCANSGATAQPSLIYMIMLMTQPTSCTTARTINTCCLELTQATLCMTPSFPSSLTSSSLDGYNLLAGPSHGMLPASGWVVSGT